MKVMVEGKDFFDGDSKLASENIPSDVVKKIEVLKNFSEVSQLKSVTNNEDNIVINLKLKEGKKNFWFGDTSDDSFAHDGGLDGYQSILIVDPTINIEYVVLSNGGQLTSLHISNIYSLIISYYNH